MPNTPPPKYRIYSLDGRSKTLGGDCFAAEDDDAAIALVQSENPDSQWELWDQKRLIARSGGADDRIARTG